MSVYKRIFHLLKPCRKALIVGLMFHTVTIGVVLVTPFVQRSVINDVIKGGNTALLIPLCVTLLLISVVKGILNYSRSIIMELASQRTCVNFRTAMFKHLQGMPFEFFDKNRIGEIMSRMTGDIEGLRGFIAGTIITVWDNLLCFVGALIAMSVMSWQITLLMLAFAPLICAFAFLFNKRIKPAFTAIHEQNAVLNTRTTEDLSGMRVVKAFVREDYESKRFTEENRKLLDRHLTATRIWSNFVPIMDMLSGFCSPTAMIIGAVMAAQGRLDIGTLYAVTTFTWMLVNPMRALSGIINSLAQAVTSADRLFYYMDLGASIVEPKDAESPAEFRGRVVFDHVNFSYGDEPILKDICLTAEPGQTVAIMGATGSGKSTLVSLLSRFYDIQSGSVSVDGIDVRRQKLEPLRRNIAYVMQETFLFSDTLEDNIRFGRPDAEHPRVVTAAEVARATEFISGMPDGYETVVGERGVGLSGGQKQRVSIARAVLTDPAILVLDDATSAIDMETEYEIQQSMKAVLKNRTTFVIAHRISSVMGADQIIVLDHGAIVERGDHKELMEKQGIYYHMVMEQVKGACA